MDSKHTIYSNTSERQYCCCTHFIEKRYSVLNLNGRMYTLLEDIPQGHKFALEKSAPVKL